MADYFTESTRWNLTHGCQKLSPGCQNCWAERMVTRHRNAATKGGRWSGEVMTFPRRLERPLHWRKPRVVSVNFTGDFFYERVPFEFIAAVFGVMAATPQHTYLVLTKRPERMFEFYRWVEKRAKEGLRLSPHDEATWRTLQFLANTWPLPNVWVGISAENQTTLQSRISALNKIPAAKKWLSLEPLLCAVDLDPPWCQDCGDWDVWEGDDGTPFCPECESEMCHGAILDPFAEENGSGVSWVVVGGESGPRARHLGLEPIRSVIRQCREAGIPVHVKQVHLGNPDGSCELVCCKPRLSKDPREWPADLRIQDWPEVSRG